MVERDESPRLACAREVWEEVGLALPIGPLLCVDYTARAGGVSEALQFVFWGGRLGAEEA